MSEVLLHTRHRHRRYFINFYLIHIFAIGVCETFNRIIDHNNRVYMYHLLGFISTHSDHVRTQGDIATAQGRWMHREKEDNMREKRNV